MSIRTIIKNYTTAISYLFFGVCTTFVNIISYWIFAHYFKFPVMLSTIIAWIFAVIFAYITNRKWVFHSNAQKTNAIIKEIFSFLSCRLLTGILDWLCMFIFVDIFRFNDLIIKVIANIIVIIVNYIASKLIIFKQK